MRVGLPNSIDKVHNVFEHQINNQYNYRNYNGSNHNKYTATDQLASSWPRNLIHEFVIRLLDIRK